MLQLNIQLNSINGWKLQPTNTNLWSVSSHCLHSLVHIENLSSLNCHLLRITSIIMGNHYPYVLSSTQKSIQYLPIIFNLLLHMTKREIKPPHLRSWNPLKCSIFSSFCLKITESLFSLYLFIASAHRPFKYLLPLKPLLMTSVRVSDTCPLSHEGLHLKISFIIYWGILHIITTGVNTGGANFSTAVGMNAKRECRVCHCFFNHQNLFKVELINYLHRRLKIRNGLNPVACIRVPQLTSKIKEKIHLKFQKNKTWYICVYICVSIVLVRGYTETSIRGGRDERGVWCESIVTGEGGYGCDLLGMAPQLL